MKYVTFSSVTQLNVQLSGFNNRHIIHLFRLNYLFNQVLNNSLFIILKLTLKHTYKSSPRTETIKYTLNSLGLLLLFFSLLRNPL